MELFEVVDDFRIDEVVVDAGFWLLDYRLDFLVFNEERVFTLQLFLEQLHQLQISRLPLTPLLVLEFAQQRPINTIIVTDFSKQIVLFLLRLEELIIPFMHPCHHFRQLVIPRHVDLVRKRGRFPFRERGY